MNETNNYTVEEQSKGFFIIRDDISQNNGTKMQDMSLKLRSSLKKTDYEKLIISLYKSLKNSIGIR